MLTLQVSRYCLLALQGSVIGLSGLSVQILTRLFYKLYSADPCPANLFVTIIHQLETRIYNEMPMMRAVIRQ